MSLLIIFPEELILTLTPICNNNYDYIYSKQILYKNKHIKNNK